MCIPYTNIDKKCGVLLNQSQDRYIYVYEYLSKLNAVSNTCGRVCQC